MPVFYVMQLALLLDFIVVCANQSSFMMWMIIDIRYWGVAHQEWIRLCQLTSMNLDTNQKCNLSSNLQFINVATTKRTYVFEILLFSRYHVNAREALLQLPMYNISCLSVKGWYMYLSVMWMPLYSSIC